LQTTDSVWLDRFAKLTLATYRDEGDFVIELESREEAEALKAVYERLGCFVEAEPFTARLHVFTREGALQ